MVVYVLHHYFDTPDVEGNEIIGVYSSIEDAQAKMKSCEAKLREEFPDDIWDGDMTWTDADEIHLGFEDKCGGGFLATIYCWEIVSREVQ